MTIEKYTISKIIEFLDNIGGLPELTDKRHILMFKEIKRRLYKLEEYKKEGK